MIKDFVHLITQDMVMDCDTTAAVEVALRNCPDRDGVVTWADMDSEHARLLVTLQTDMWERFEEIIQRLADLERQVAHMKTMTVS
ncbi:hypothetical protein ACFYXL_18410 [Streptomyces tsukubensis]|uniref:hypothetical protein n=1 Tax=Streptomyces tsukubensis TaxID=83656 RepID=UPI00369BF602